MPLPGHFKGRLGGGLMTEAASLRRGGNADVRRGSGGGGRRKKQESADLLHGAGSAEALFQYIPGSVQKGKEKIKTETKRITSLKVTLPPFSPSAPRCLASPVSPKRNGGCWLLNTSRCRHGCNTFCASQPGSLFLLLPRPSKRKGGGKHLAISCAKEAGRKRRGRNAGRQLLFSTSKGQVPN